MKTRTHKNYYGNKKNANTLVQKINNYWKNEGYSNFYSWLEPETRTTPSGRREIVYNIRSNIVVRATPSWYN